MICYRDRTFCNSDCTNEECQRNYTKERHEQNINGVNLPVAMADFSKNCDRYQEPEE